MLLSDSRSCAYPSGPVTITWPARTVWPGITAHNSPALSMETRPVSVRTRLVSALICAMATGEMHPASSATVKNMGRYRDLPRVFIGVDVEVVVRFGLTLCDLAAGCPDCSTGSVLPKFRSCHGTLKSIKPKDRAQYVYFAEWRCAVAPPVLQRNMVVMNLEVDVDVEKCRSRQGTRRNQLRMEGYSGPC